MIFVLHFLLEVIFSHLKLVWQTNVKATEWQYKHNKHNSNLKFLLIKLLKYFLQYKFCLHKTHVKLFSCLSKCSRFLKMYSLDIIGHLLRYSSIFCEIIVNFIDPILLNTTAMLRLDFGFAFQNW